MTNQVTIQVHNLAGTITPFDQLPPLEQYNVVQHIFSDTLLAIGKIEDEGKRQTYRNKLQAAMDRGTAIGQYGEIQAVRMLVSMGL